MKITSILSVASLVGLALVPVSADVKLPSIISDHMVLKKAAKVPIWGKADPGENVTVTMDGQVVKAVADRDGKWMTELNLQNEKQGPFSMAIEGKNKVTIDDVVVGEVWIASGQSNMTFSLNIALESPAEIALPANPMLRQFHFERAAVPDPQDNTPGRWMSATPTTLPGFSAVAYFFGKTLQDELQVPVGLINRNWGGTPAESWTSAEALASVPDLKQGAETSRQKFKDYTAAKEQFTADFGKWLTDTKREDQTGADAATFAAPEVSTKDWVAVKVPGVIAGEGLPADGAIWLRTEVTVPPTAAGQSMRLILGPIEGFDTAYWNGKQVGQTTWQTYPGTGYGRNYNLSAGEVKEGANTLAIRIFSPAGPIKFSLIPKAENILLNTGWVAKAEFTLPPLDPATLMFVPKPPASFAGPQMVSSFLYNGMIYPLKPYALSGVIWYQGEENSGRAFQYRTTLPLLIGDWRSQWKQGDFPFYICQLANFMVKQPMPGDSRWAELREAQSMALKVPNTGRAVLIDLGDSGNIHPRHKKPVGERLAQIALARDYGKTVPYSGPEYQSMMVEKDKIRVKFDLAGGAMVAHPLPATYSVDSAFGKEAPLVRNSPQSELEGFAICGEDHKWVWADAKIDGSDVLVWSDKVPAPVAVRYAWADNPTCNLYNTAGFPAAPFRTDDLPTLTQDVKYGFEASSDRLKTP